MNTYKFRVLIDIEDDVFRDIELRGDQNYEDFHHAIIKAFDFFGDQMASFYVSNEEWERGEEIVLMDMGFEGPDTPPVMATSTIESLVGSPQQKFLYVYDFLRMWIFYIELLEVNEADHVSVYPVTRMAFGDAPLESSKEIPEDLGLSDPFAAGLADFDDEEDLGDEIGDIFDSLEDYDEF